MNSTWMCKRQIGIHKIEPRKKTQSIADGQGITAE